MRPKKGWKVNKELNGRESRMRLKKGLESKEGIKGEEKQNETKKDEKVWKELK